MADSVDRVFGHALNTVTKIRPGSQKPPTVDRLALYGLYKQSMEGDASLISSRPASSTKLSSETSGGQNGNAAERLTREQEKWDAWKANEGFSRTEAKRRYIEKLIDTMHQFASGTEEARELVEELEFVWDQIKNNSLEGSGSSERSSPLRPDASSSNRGGEGEEDEGSEKPAPPPMRVLQPMSEIDAEEELERRELSKVMDVGDAGVGDLLEDGEEPLDAEEDEFVDAPVSQIDNDDIPDPLSAQPDTSEQPQKRSTARGISALDKRFRSQVSSTLTRLTTEIAALREQLESRQFIKDQRRRTGFWSWFWRIGWWGLQIFVADAFLLMLVMWYLRRKGDGRLEGAVRVLLGDAVVASLREKVKAAGRELPGPVRRMGGMRRIGGGGAGNDSQGGGGIFGGDAG